LIDFKFALNDFNMSLRIFHGLDWTTKDTPWKKESPRSNDCQVEFRFQMISLEFSQFTAASQIASRLALSIRDFLIVDNVETSTWQKFLSYTLPESDEAPRENGSVMVDIEYVFVRPDVERDCREARLKV
jgi:hypothetical protein